MFLLSLEFLGLFSVNCFEGGQPCGSGSDARKDVLDIIESLECAGLYLVTDECKALVKESEDNLSDAIAKLAESGGDLDFTWDKSTLLMEAAT